MKIAFIGVGKLGGPCALAAADDMGHEVVGYDANPAVKEMFASRKYPHQEVIAQELIEKTNLRIVDTVAEAVAHADLLLIAVPTPHQALYEGLNRMPETRADFDYTALRASVKAVADEAQRQNKQVVIDVISTALPGTCQREVYPLLNKFTGFVYTPYFIAMGTTITDFLKPEFTLIGFDKEIGANSHGALEMVQNFYRSIHNAPHQVMSVVSAELCKVAYNVLLGQKILAANSIMEIAHKTGANCDDVMDALGKATDRIVSTKYLRGGMGDGGGCFVEGELIHTEDGVCVIEEIEKGDRVLGGDGKYHEVLETYRRPYKGKVFTLKGRGLTRFTVTGEHPIHVAADLRHIKSDGRRDQTKGPQLGEVQEMRADRLTEDFYIAFPSPIDVSTRDEWEAPRGKSGPAPRPINTRTDAFVLLAGYFMGEGSIWFDKNKNFAPMRAQFAFNTLTDGDYIAECKRCLEEIVPGAPIRVKTTNDRESCTEVRVDNTMLAKTLDHYFGHGHENKRIPAWILNSDKFSALCLRALFRGDGSSHKEGLSFSSTSPNLAHGVSLMLRRHGIPSTLQFHPRRVGADGVAHKAAYDLGVNNAAYLNKLSEIVGMPIRHQMQEKQYPNYIFERNGVWYHKVYSVEPSEYEGTVYNLNVADVHNYVSVGGLVSNCHPRDQIALSWLAEKLHLSYDLFGSMVSARELQTQWLGELCLDLTDGMDGKAKLPVIILGKAYKKGTHLVDGSPAILLKNILSETLSDVEQWDPHVDPPREFNSPAVFLIGTDHDEFFKDFLFPWGSIVVDPWGRMADRVGCRVIRVGRH